MAIIRGQFDDARVKRGGSGGFPLPVDKYYPIIIAEIVEKSANSVEAKLIVSEGEGEGTQVSTFPGTDLSKAGNRNTWITIHAATGGDPAELQTGSEIELDTDNYVGKAAWMYVRGKKDAEGNDLRPDISIVPAPAEDEVAATEEEAPAAKPAAAKAPVKAAAPAAKPAAKAPAAPAAPAPKAAAGDLLARLKAKANGAAAGA